MYNCDPRNHLTTISQLTDRIKCIKILLQLHNMLIFDHAVFTSSGGSGSFSAISTKRATGDSSRGMILVRYQILYPK